jgi:succinate dehydrogenase / fumarate reductase cytochrome b subunit
MPMTAETKSKPAPPERLGVRGWAYAGRYSVERYLYVLHRLTGLGLIAYLLLHIVETGQRQAGEAAWSGLMALFTTPVFRGLEYLLFAAFVFHALNGARLLVTELGFGLGRPGHPVYPYASSVKRQRPLMLVLMGLAAVLLILGGSSLFFS